MRVKRAFTITALVLVLIIGGCTLLLPERFAINAPIMNTLFGWGGGTPEQNLFARRMKLPEGYHISVYAEGLGHARIMHWTEAGDLLVSIPRAGEVKRLSPDKDGDGRADSIQTIAGGFNRLHGIAVHDGYLYVGETDAVKRVAFDVEKGIVTGAPETILAGLPGGGNHWTRTLRLGPDGMFYMNVGSSCNVCVEEDDRRATLMRFEPDGSNPEIFAAGLRNTVGWDWHPDTDELYGVDNGRDLLGDDYPPCELNLIEKDAFYGWPYRNADNDPDPDFGTETGPHITNAEAPVHGFGAHTAPLSIHFVEGDDLPGLERAALVALHGSWNRTRKSGYKVVSLHWRDDGSIEERDFLTGFEKDEDVIGRPVDITQGPDGALYVSDDYAGTIYRIAYGEEERRAARPTRTQGAGAGDTTRIDPALQTEGANLWETHECATCHTEGRSGSVVLRGLYKKHTVQSITALLETPPGGMPSFPLAIGEKHALAAYLLHRFK